MTAPAAPASSAATKPPFANAVHCAAAPIPGGWIAAMLETEPVADSAIADSAKQEPDAWARPVRRRVRAVLAKSGRCREWPAVAVERAGGVDVAGGADPAVAWTEKRPNGTWQVRLMDKHGSRTLLTQKQALGRIACCAIAGGAGRLLAVEAPAGGGKTRLLLVDAAGGGVKEDFPGGNPCLAGAPDGSAALVYETVAAVPGVFTLALRRFTAAGKPKAETRLPDFGGAHAFNPHAVFTADGNLWLAHELAWGLGFNERLGAHRELCLWQAPAAGSGPFLPAPGTANGVLPVPREAHWDKGFHNMPPVFPKIFAGAKDTVPGVAFRRSHFNGHRAFGWQTFALFFRNGFWSAPGLVAPELSLGDSAYAVVPGTSSLIAFLPCCDVEASTPWADVAAGVPFLQGAGRSRRAGNFRLEIRQFKPGGLPPPTPVPEQYQGPYFVPPRYRADFCPEPPPLAAAPAGLQLVWADLHAHSSYSKCMGPDNGFPADCMRFQRDLLGNRVLCLVEHQNQIGDEEFTQVYDTLEREAGNGCVAVYGMEPGSAPAHHQNIYCIDRAVFEKLRRIYATSGRHQDEVFPRLLAELPAGSVFVARHGHGSPNGEFGMNSPDTVKLFNPELELAMEATQLRGDMMWDETGRIVKHPFFPNNYLDAGARIALLGGTDHSNPPGPNHFCLTGLWVEALTAEAVFAAIRARRTLACSNGKIAVHATLNGIPAGGEVKLGRKCGVRIQVAAASANGLTRACLLRDGVRLPWLDLTGETADFMLDDPEPPTAGRHWYSVVVQARPRLSRQPVSAFVSPFFVGG